MAQSAPFSKDGERCQSLSSLHTVFFFFPLSNHRMMMLPKWSSPDLQGIPPALGEVWQRKLCSHLHLLYPNAGWWSCGSRGTNQTHSRLRSFFPEGGKLSWCLSCTRIIPIFRAVPAHSGCAQSCPLSCPTIVYFFFTYLRIYPEFSGV